MPATATAAFALQVLNFDVTRTPSFAASVAAINAVEAARLTLLRSNFAKRTSSRAGALGRLDEAIHADPRFGAALDSLIAAPNRSGPLGFDYGLVQRRAQEVDDLLRDSPQASDLAEATEEAQDAAGLSEDVMFDFTQTLGIPAPQRAHSPSAAAILFVTTVGRDCCRFG